MLEICNFWSGSFFKKKDFAQESISELLKYGSTMEAEKPPEVINPQSVFINYSGKKRLILPLRYVNTHAYKNEIKFGTGNALETT